MGMTVFIFYIIAFGFYLWIRITKTLDIGAYQWYGIIVLAVECMGASTVVLYGTNLLFNPVNEIVLQENPEGVGPGILKVTCHFNLLENVTCCKGRVVPGVNVNHNMWSISMQCR